MANISFTLTPNQNVHLLRPKWTPMANGDVGIALGVNNDAGVFADKSVQVFGTFGAGGTCLIEGSNDGGTTWATLNDAFGNALSITSAGIKQITEAVDQIRPRISAGDGTTSLTVSMLLRKVHV